MENKILFLDVDGVLNIMSETYYSHGFDTIGSDPIEPHLMRRLEFIMERVPDCNIVISSSWEKSQLERKLSKYRFKYLDRIIDRTPRHPDRRGNQIKEWLDNNPCDSYVVLEDEIFDVCGDRCDTIPKANVIEVDMNEGLSNKNTIDAVCILNNMTLEFGSYDLTPEVYDKYYALGYRTRQGGSREFLLKNWRYILLNKDTLDMQMA